MRFSRNADTRGLLLRTLEQLSRLGLTLAALRVRQGRVARAAAARLAAELFTPGRPGGPTLRPRTREV